MIRRRASLVVLVALLAPAACSDDGPAAGEARLEVDGTAVVERAGGDRDTVNGSTDVRRGDRVSMQEGVAIMRLAGGTVLELREGFDDAADTTVLMGDRPVVEAGELLVATPGTVDLEADGTKVRLERGAARITRAFGMRVAAYDADITLDSAGVTAAVPALRQMVVPDLGRPPQQARPITYDDGDTWDLRFLGAAMALGERLENFADGLTRTLPDGEGRTPGFFRLALPGLDDEVAFDAELLQPRLGRDPGDNLVGAAITELGERGAFAERWSDVFAFRDAGAAWGIVALEQSVRSDPLIGSVEDALDASFQDAGFALPPAVPETGSAPSVPTTTAPGEAPSTSTTGPAGRPTSPTTTAPPTSPPPSVPEPALPPVLPPVLPPSVPPPAVLAPVLEPVTDLVGDLVGGLLGSVLP